MIQLRRKSSQPATYAVITADVIGSRRIAGFRKKRDAVLRPVSESHMAQGLVLSPYAVTVWDEFQAIIPSPDLFPKTVLDLRRRFYPMQLRIAVGMGTVTEPKKSPVNQFAGGEAFERARAAMDRLKSTRGHKYPLLTAVESGDRELDLATNAIYLLHDTLVSDRSPAQWKAIQWVARLGSQERAARKLRVNVSTVSRTLRRAHYWQVEDTAQAMQEFLRERFGVAR